MQIGVAGIGAMGAAVAARLMEVGHQVTIWNRNADKTKPLTAAGAKVAASPAALAGDCEAVITLLTGDTAIDAVYNGPKSAVAALTPFLTVSTGPAYTLAGALAGQSTVSEPTTGNPPAF